MHFHCEIWIPTCENVGEQVEKAMAPYYEERGEGFWDWYQIGGMWKGVHVPGYDSHKDPENQCRCRQCNGTGKRPDLESIRAEKGEEDFNKWMEQTKGCNTCGGTGIEVRWPTDWCSHPKDITPVSEIPEDLSPYTFIVKGKVFYAEEFVQDAPTIEEKFVKTPFSIKETLRSMGITDGYLVTVDYHG